MFVGISKQTAVGDRLHSYNFEPGDTYTGVSDWGNCQRCRLHHTRHRVAIKRVGGTGHTRLLFIGEAPGETENKTGIPFVGVAGKILHHLFKLTHFQFQYCITNTVGCRPVDVAFLDSSYDAKLETEWEISEDVKDRNKALKSDPTFSLNDYIYLDDYEFMNWNREPTKSEINLCKPHIDELMETFKPHGVVYLGKVAESYKDPNYLVPLESYIGDPQARHYKHVAYNDEWVKRYVPTLSLSHPAYIARLEYKLLTVRKEARKLDEFVERFLG